MFCLITLTRSVKFSALSLSAFYWAPIFVTFSPTYITAQTSWVRSVSFEFEIGKVFSLPSEYEKLSLRLVWSRVCAFLYSLRPWLRSLPSYLIGFAKLKKFHFQKSKRNWIELTPPTHPPSTFYFLETHSSLILSGQNTQIIITNNF